MRTCRVFAQTVTYYIPLAIVTVQNVLKVYLTPNEAATTYSGSAGKLKTCHHHLQISNVAVHMYPLQLMQAKVLPINFEDDDDKLTLKTIKMKICTNFYLHVIWDKAINMYTGTCYSVEYVLT